MSKRTNKQQTLIKKIFITIPWFLPAVKAGGPIRSIANLVDQYAGASFYIFTGNCELTGERLTGIVEKKWVEFNAHTKVWYAPKSNSKLQLVKEIEHLKPDVLFMTGLYSWRFTLTPLIYGNVRNKIVSVRGMLHPGALNQKGWKKRWFLRVFKWMKFPQRIWFHATDEEEERFIKNVFGKKARVCVAANLPTRFGEAPLPDKNPGELKLITISLISPMKNLLKVLKALALVKSKISYNIYGAVKDKEYWDQCKTAIQSLPENVKVIYKGVISHSNVLSCLTENHLFIMPSESENFGHSLYEALSAGRPAITSYNTPWKDLKECRAGINLNPGDEKEIVRAIEFFSTMDEKELAEWSQSAHQYAVERTDMEKLLAEYEVMFGREG